MKSVRPPIAKLSAKVPTGITGFDEITGCGLPHDRTTLLVGGPGSGSGNNLFALQFSKTADTWIHLNCLLQAGERNRGMFIINSRGTTHPNQCAS